MKFGLSMRWAVYCLLYLCLRTEAQEFRKVGARTYSILAPEWTAFMSEPIKVFGIDGGVLGCVPYSTTTVQGQANVAAGAGKHRIEATFRTTTNFYWQKAFALKNFPKQNMAE